MFKQQFNDINDLRKTLKVVVDDYNNKRPHISLNGLTPDEAYNGVTINRKQISEQIRLSKANRIALNQKAICEICD